MYYFHQAYTYSHPWSHVVIGMWHKYPNPHCSHVVSIDVVDRTIDPDTGVIRTERILGCKQKAPIWIVKLFGGSEDAFVREVIYVDPINRQTTMSSINMSLSQFATCREKITYSPDLANSAQQTIFSQTAEIQSRLGLWKSATEKLETFLAQRFEQNALKGKLGFTDVLKTMWGARSEDANMLS